MAGSGDLCAHSGALVPHGFAFLRQHIDFRLLLATFVITACYADWKPGVRILAVAGNLRTQDPKITPEKNPATADHSVLC